MPTCKKEYYRKYNELNKERIKIQSREYYSKNRERILDRQKNRQIEKRKEINEYLQKYFSIPENRERRRKYTKEHMKEYRKLHPEKIREYNKKSYLKHKEKNNKRSREYNKIWYLNNLEYRKSEKYKKVGRESARKQRQKEGYNERRKEWLLNNPEKARAYRKLTAMRKRNHKGTVKDIQKAYEDNIKKYGTLTCILCNKTIEFGQDSIEHKVPFSRGGTNKYENLAIAHSRCNSKKHTLTLEEWFKRMEFENAQH